MKTKVRGIHRPDFHKSFLFSFRSAEALIHPLGFTRRDLFALGPRLTAFSAVKPLEQPHAGMLSKVAATLERSRSPAYLITATSGEAKESFLTQFEKIVLEPHGAGRIQQYRTGNPDAVLLIAPAGKNAQSGLVARLPLTKLALARCQKHWNTIRFLSSEQEGILSNKVPRAIGSGEFSGQPYFLESFIPGLALTDPKPAALRQGMREAVPLIIAFHQASAARRVVDLAVFNEMASPFFDGLLPYIKEEETRKRFHYLSDFLRERLVGQRLPFVYSHGDWQVENMVFDPTTFQVRGVLDWDLSQPDGLPLLDLLYLLLYAETLMGGGDFEAIFSRRFLASRFRQEEQAAIERYQSAVGVAQDITLPLLVFLWLHHLVFRLEPIWRRLDEWMRTVFAPVLLNVCEVLRREKG